MLNLYYFQTSIDSYPHSTVRNLKEKYQTFTDEQLLEILVNREDYVEDAIRVVEDLVSERNINEEVKNSIFEQLNEEKQEIRKRADEPLGLGMKILFLFLPFFGFVGFALAQTHYHEKGNEQKKADTAKFMFIGFFLWVVVLSVLAM